MDVSKFCSVWLAGPTCVTIADLQPDFWLDFFAETGLIKVYDCDVPVLRHLVDVKGELDGENGVGFTLKFFFSENEFFEDSVISKTYDWIGVHTVTGSCISWKEGQCVTKRDGDRSFFNFFNTPEESDQEFDYHLGAYIYQRALRKIRFYTEIIRAASICDTRPRESRIVIDIKREWEYFKIVSDIRITKPTDFKATVRSAWHYVRNPGAKRDQAPSKYARNLRAKRHQVRGQYVSYKQLFAVDCA